MHNIRRGAGAYHSPDEGHLRLCQVGDGACARVHDSLRVDGAGELQNEHREDVILHGLILCMQTRR